MSDQDKKPAGKVAENSNSTEKSSTEKPSNVTPLRPTRPCPECGKASHRDSYPFCSPRCRSVDLNRWLSDAYVIPGRLSDDEDEPQD